MEKEFNDTGLCIPGRHYMADMSQKIEQIVRLVEKAKYFAIHRPRQFGKTTTLSLLEKRLNEKEDYLAFNISFEDIDTETFQKQEAFIDVFLNMLKTECDLMKMTELSEFINEHGKQISSMPSLSQFITDMIGSRISGKSLVLMIDEVDKSSNNQLFLDFLGMLRKKYLRRSEGKDHTFQSVVLAGVHDIKTLKTKIRHEDQQKYNSPWNIAVDFTIDMTFNPTEIGSMLQEYCDDKHIQADIPAIAEKLHYYTSGYPYLVSKLCKFIDERIISERGEKNWFADDADESFKMIADQSYTTTLFDSLTKNLENNPELYDTVLDMVINGRTMKFTISNPIISLGHIYGIISKADDGRCKIHNRIFEQRIYAYMMSKLERTHYDINGFAGPEYYRDDELDVRTVLLKFQAFMKEHYSRKDEKFLEREGRLLFLSFLQPIINGKGFEFKEPNVSDERRMDVVITYKTKRYVVELKRWYGPRAHQEGLQQLSDYLDMVSLKEGYLLIYDFSMNKEYKQEEICFQDKLIYAVWV